MTFTSKILFSFTVTAFAVFLALFAGHSIIMEQSGGNVLMAQITGEQEPDLMTLASEWAETDSGRGAEQALNDCEDTNSPSCYGRYQTK